MNAKNGAAIFSIIMGVSMIGIWIVLYISDGIPEINTKPIELGMHLLAEFITAIALIVGGTALIKNKFWGLNVYLLSMGMLVYTLIQSPGYFLQQGEIALVSMFAVFFIIALIFIIVILTSKGKFNTKDNL